MKKGFYRVAKKYKWVFLSVSLPLILLFLTILGFSLFYRNRIFPGVYVVGIKASGMTTDELQTALIKAVVFPEKLVVFAKEKSFDLSLHEIGFGYDYDKTVKSAYSLYRSENFLLNFLYNLQSPFQKREVNLVINIDEEKLNEYLQVVSSQVAVEPIYPNVVYQEARVVVNKGVAGEDIDPKAIKKKLENKLSRRDYSRVELPLKNIDPTISDDEAGRLQERAEKLIGKTLNLSYEYTNIVLKEDDLFKLLDPHKSYNGENILEFTNKEVALKVNREPQNAVFQFENGKVIEFTPAKNGITVNTQLFKDQLIEKLTFLETSEEKTSTLNVPVQTAPPSITTEQVNNLGIKELLGSGVSTFRGSIPGRVFNIGHAASKLNGVLVPPGETLSFNSAVGEVSTLTGYKQAYIIKDGMTVLGDGGGVCQVSTTLFRAALNAGLPIEERRAHSYRVAYYEQNSAPGLDATVYAPTTDLKIKKDTPGHILVQTIFKPEEVTLIFEIYGTSDGRVATITKPVITSVSAPPEDLYIDDPTLPIGQIKQIDYKAWGAKVVFDYEVDRNGETIYEKKFVSNFRPWQAKFLRGTGPTN